MLAFRRKALRGYRAASILVLPLSLMFLSGCAGGVSHAVSPDLTPLGTSNVTITLTDASGASQSFVVALTVIAPYPLQ
jgi:hypothetical protein